LLRVIELPATDRQPQSGDAGQLEAGRDVIIAGSVTDDDAKKTYPNGWKSPKPYIRIVPQPAVVRSRVASSE